MLSRILLGCVLIAGPFTAVVCGQDITKYITVDQFGYRPESRKIAVIRNPVTGYDAAEAFTPGSSYSVVDAASGEPVFSGSVMPWNSGITDASSGDRAWWFDFSSVQIPGTYYIVDEQNNVRSYEFEVGDDIYQNILKQAVRTFFYQRAGFKKDAAFAGDAWADGGSHLGALQDKNARRYDQKNTASSERDLSGGWYDAGDYNKYTNWTANYVVDFMRAYLEKPSVWGDDYNIPESGNFIPDILDEAKWGIDHLLRMQNDNGSVLSIVGLAHASPPSSATGQSLYGKESTSATLNTAAAFAISSKVFASRGMKAYSDKLKQSAIKAWDWAVANPNVIFKNNDNASGTQGLGAGQQETDDYGRLVAKMEAALFLFEITGEAKYKDFFEANYTKIHLMEWNFAYPFETSNQEILLYYAGLPEANAAIADNILNVYNNAMNSGDNFGAISGNKDPYGAYIKDYTWGSNSTKASQGLMFMDMITHAVDATKYEGAEEAAEGYLHYLHGVNPLGFVYLSNMFDHGGDHGVREFYHTWFANGSEKWDRVGTSTYGPPPGFVTGGPNPSYDRDGCCATNSCGGSNALCDSEDLTPPMGQPDQKSYKDFNTSWPLNSWSVTENSNGYQLNYIRLLSHFVPAEYDCSGTADGGASFDVCNVCSGGNTGIAPGTDANACKDEGPVTGIEKSRKAAVNIYPNPTRSSVQVYVPSNLTNFSFSIYNSQSVMMLERVYDGGTVSISLDDFPAGLYLIVVRIGTDISSHRVVKQ